MISVTLDAGVGELTPTRPAKARGEGVVPEPLAFARSLEMTKEPADRQRLRGSPKGGGSRGEYPGQLDIKRKS